MAIVRLRLQFAKFFDNVLDTRGVVPAGREAQGDKFLGRAIRAAIHRFLGRNRLFGLKPCAYPHTGQGRGVEGIFDIVTSNISEEDLQSIFFSE